MIRVGDKIKYMPTNTIFKVKEIYAGEQDGIFNCAGGKLKFKRAIAIFYGDRGHYPIDDNIQLISSIGNFD